ncbi:DUF4136 domain-containing protein [Adhaeribacter aquaticus]|uniref:DUF4136 domain-containing protein n=1 Tax=Adhaeribacter aquaticus TaxID=299567 RepID=UPI000408EBBD|nr:DUF4136 domain-containing protein [Adhaeribacter aquaticus]
MKRSIYLLVTLLVLGLASCAPGVFVSTDYDTATNFRALKTYSWYPNPNKGKTDSVHYDTFFDKRMKRALQTQLSAQGLTYSNSNPDIYVAYNVGFSSETRLNRNFSPYGFGYYYGYPFGNTAQQYKEGTVTVDFVDARKKEMIWRGVAETEVKSTNISEEKIQTIVTSIMRKYPAYNNNVANK